MLNASFSKNNNLKNLCNKVTLFCLHFVSKVVLTVNRLNSKHVKTELKHV